MPLRIVIPSHKRAERVYAKRVVSDPIICVAESQAESYRKCNPECEVVAHPDSVVGLIPKRNWMARHFGDLFMLDDDVRAMKALYAEKGESNGVNDPADARRRIEELYDIACMLDVHLWGYTARITPVMYEENEWLSLSKMITGCSYGVRAGGAAWWNEELRLKEDFWISCYMKYKERRILTDLRYSFSQKDTFVNPGGLSALRTQEEELFIRKHFGESVRLKGDTGNGNKHTRQMVQYNITCSFKF